MKLYKLTQEVNNDYDTYNSCVVAAKNEDEARLIHPDEWPDVKKVDNWAMFSVWAYKPDQVAVEYLGTAKPGTKKGVILASFNAG